MYTLKIIKNNKEFWYNLGTKFNIEYDPFVPECSNWNAENLSCYITDEKDGLFEILLDEEAYILNENGKTLKVVNWKGHKANIKSELK